jgi:hypothetical protein
MPISGASLRAHCGGLIRSAATVAVLGLLGALAGPASAAGFAPVDRPGPALPPSLSAAAAKATKCSAKTAVDHTTRSPVLLVPGTGASSDDNYRWNYERAFDALGIPWCAITFIDNGNDDVQVNGEYLVAAIRTLHARAGRRIDIVGHSQGGMVPRWALRFWPDTRPMVDDVIGFAGTNHGTTMAHASCPRGCIPADAQQASDSRFIQALNSGQETFPGISYTEVYSHFDEEVQPNLDNNGTSSLHGGGGRITDVAVQDICPGDVVEHLGLGTYDPVAYALALDAITHDGPADPARIASSVCLERFQPGVDPLTFPTDSAAAAVSVETSSGQTVTQEPALACYVFAAGCPSTRLAPPACTRSRTLVFSLPRRPGRRAVAVSVRLDRRIVVRRRGRSLRTVTVRRAPVTGTHTLRITIRYSDRVRLTLVRHLRGCGTARRR